MTLWRYILRKHIGPFLFANAIIVFLFLLQFLMKSAGDLVGKGLSIWVILELISLNLAWMLVLSVPMATLVSTLMAFGGMAANNETVIMRASGMSLYRMLLPVLIAAGVVTVGLIHFNNAILPEANIRLRTLMTDIIRVKPTLTIQAGVFSSEEELPNHRILVRRTFEHRNDLEGVTIYDLTYPEKNIVVTAERGQVSFSSDYRRMFMDLEDGEIHELNAETMISYRRLRFHRHRVSIPAHGFDFQRSDASTAQRDDRTMSAQMMQVIVDSARKEQSRKIDRLEERLLRHFESYRTGRPEFQSGVRSELIPVRIPETVADSAVPAAFTGIFTRVDTMEALKHALTDIRQMQNSVMVDVGGIMFDETQMNKYLVEIYKKYSIPVACLVFALIGVPLGMMARRGGFGVGAGLSLGFFLFYWACLIAGEKLADRNVLEPFVGMWIANIILGLMGIWLVTRMARESAVIDWRRLERFLPKTWRVQRPEEGFNPHEA